MVRRPLLIIVLVALAAGAPALASLPPAQASPRAQTGVGVADVTTAGAHHPWLGAWRVAVGPGGPVVNAYCIRTGGWFPGSPSWPVADIAGPRGASDTDRAAMSYLLWRHGDTSDPITAAGLNVALYSLSGDHSTPGVRYPPPARMAISHPAVAAAALRLYDEGMRRRGPWTVQVAAAPRPDDPSRIRATAHVSGPGGPVPDARAFVRITNGPGSGGYATDGAGNLVIDVPPDDPAAPVRIDVAFGVPGDYQTLRDVEVPARQVVVHGVGAARTGSARAAVPAGEVAITKRNSNPAWQDDAGARFELRRDGPDGPVARALGGEPAVAVTDADGSAPRLRMPPGTYWVTETEAPVGQSVGFEARPITVAPGATETVDAENPADATAELVLTKVDAETDALLAGGRFLVERDHHDTWEFAPQSIAAATEGHARSVGESRTTGGSGRGDHGAAPGSEDEDSEHGVVTSGDEPVVVGSLLAGRYRVTELEAPPGYTLPEVREVVVELGVGESTAVDFADVRPMITTEVSAPEVLVGDEIVDTVVVSNVASWNRGQVRVELYGPFEPDVPMVCDDAHLVAQETWETVGPGTFESPAFTVVEAGIYTFVGTWSSLEPGDASSATHECGLADETVVVRAPMTLEGVKFNAEDREQRLAGGVYDVLVADGDLPTELVDDLRDGVGARGGRADVPDGYTLVGTDTSDDHGEMHVAVWSHARYCFEELEAPDGFVLDRELRCTDGMLTPRDAAPVELPEQPIPTELTEVAGVAAASSGPPGAVALPTTGVDLARAVAAAITASAAGGAILIALRPRSSERDRRRRAIA